MYAPLAQVKTPAEVGLASHRLLLRAGTSERPLQAYSYLPLAWRLLKIEAIIRDEMDGIGAQEILVPITTPCRALEEPGR